LNGPGSGARLTAATRVVSRRRGTDDECDGSAIDRCRVDVPSCGWCLERDLRAVRGDVRVRRGQWFVEWDIAQLAGGSVDLDEIANGCGRHDRRAVGQPRSAGVVEVAVELAVFGELALAGAVGAHREELDVLVVVVLSDLVDERDPPVLGDVPHLVVASRKSGGLPGGQVDPHDPTDGAHHRRLVEGPVAVPDLVPLVGKSEELDHVAVRVNHPGPPGLDVRR